ncbi:Panacea domain-containing protein [Acidithiobacillus sp. HP-6]|uniref:Panacea domain-containing protein n=1 Tax=Acidithiobacillus sp. HP-6 TaxID=2697655 RepID=UPI001D0D5DE5|nr:Panacea domain-containing protein [Acidithiobacillus sp. HP-6]
MINAIIYFAQNTAYCGKIKLFKLLYLLDFQHFQETGKSVTGFDYQAWKFGPVPVKLMEEWESFGEDLLNAVHIESEKVYDFERQSVKVNAGISFDESEFTPRQLRIMKSLSEAYKDTFSPAMIDVTHAQNGAWDKVWQNGKGAFDPIPYDLAVPEDGSRPQYHSGDSCRTNDAVVGPKSSTGIDPCYPAR